MLNEEQKKEDQSFIFNTEAVTGNALNELQSELVMYNELTNLALEKLNNLKLEQIKPLAVKQQLKQLRELRRNLKQELKQKKEISAKRMTTTRVYLDSSKGIESLMQELDGKRITEFTKQIAKVKNLFEAQKVQSQSVQLQVTQPLEPDPLGAAGPSNPRVQSYNLAQAPKSEESLLSYAGGGDTKHLEYDDELSFD